MSTTPRLHSLDIDNINPHVKEAKYAVRGELAIKSEEYRALLKKSAAQSHDANGPPTPPDHPLPFDKVISANIGNPQELGQKPITFFRQVLAICENPDLLKNERALRDHFNYKQDAIDRARWLLSEVGSVGAYSASAGAPAIRQSVANFIERRDGFPSDFRNVYLSTGASSGVNTLLHIIAAKPETGVLVPIPQYPLYTATLSLLDARCVPYYLEEEKAWGTDLKVIQDAYNKAVADGTDVRAIVVINPGNPTGASLTEEDVRSVIKFAAERQLVIMADEVYQTNVFIGKFHSFKRVLRQLQKDEPGKYDTVELASLNSVSKGMVGECGHRGGYFELVGFDGQVQKEIFKFISIMLCPPVIGQCLVELMVNPPKPGDPSFEIYDREYNAIKDGLKERATALYEAFKQMEGVKIGEPQGAMYLFPTITLPPKAVKAAKDAGKNPDDFYCLKLLDKTGICVVPGSGFGQQEGTLHIRTTFLAPGTDWVGRFTTFHKEFMDEYRYCEKNKKDPVKDAYDLRTLKHFTKGIVWGVNGCDGEDDFPSAKSVKQVWKNFTAQVRRDHEPVPPCTLRSTTNWLNQQINLRGLPASKRKRRYVTENHLVHLGTHLWERDWIEYKRPGIRVSMWSETLDYGFTSARIGEYLESTACANSGRGLYHRDITFIVFRNEHGEPEFAAQLKRDAKNTTWTPDKR
ncbi:hypothetical protein DV736_g736, partial [Chaetothyriales sp. CBS 134916]